MEGFFYFVVVMAIFGFAIKWAVNSAKKEELKQALGSLPTTKTELDEKLNQFWQAERAKYLVGDTILSLPKIGAAFDQTWEQVWDALSHIAGEDWLKAQTRLDKKPDNPSAGYWVTAGAMAFMPGGGGALKGGAERKRAFPQQLAAFREFYLQMVEHAKPKAAIEKDVHGSAKWATDEDLGPEYKNGGIPLGPDLHYSQDRHLLLCALNRTGKGRDVQIPTLLEYPAPTIVIDPKGQLAAVTARRRREMGHKVFVINPFQSTLHFDLASDGFNPLATLNPDDDLLVDDVRSLSEALITDQGPNDAHWVTSARNLLTLYMMWVIRNEDKKTLGKVRELITLPNDDREGETRKKLLTDMSFDDFPPLRNGVGRFLSKNTEIDNIFSGLDNQTAFLDSPNIARCLSGDSGLRFSDMKTKDITVYLVIPPQYLESHGRVLRLVVMSALFGLYKSPLPKGRLPVLFMLDEFPALGHLSLVEQAMGAAAGYGVQLWPCIQNLPQLEDRYKGSWQTFVDNSGVIQILGTNNNRTADYFSEKAGKRTVTVSGESESLGAGGRPTMGTSTHETGVPLIEPLEFGRLGDDRQILFIYGKGPLRWTRKESLISSPTASIRACMTLTPTTSKMMWFDLVDRV